MADPVFGVRIKEQVLVRFRATVRGLRRTNDDDAELTLGEAAEEALVDWIERQEREHHAGQPWPIPPATSRRNRGDSGGITPQGPNP